MKRNVDSPSLHSKPPKAEFQVLEVGSLLTTVFAILGFSARAAGVRLTVDVSLRGRRLLGNRSLLLQVLVNLATNAIQAVGAGGRVTLAARPGEERDVVFEIADNGPGIPFFTTKTEATGLGSATVWSWVKEMGGTIQLESAPPRGTRCRLTFPTAPEEPDHGEHDVSADH
jgi:signal transduction histidine kinase